MTTIEIACNVITVLAMLAGMAALLPATTAPRAIPPRQTTAAVDAPLAATADHRTTTREARP